MGVDPPWKMVESQISVAPKNCGLGLLLTVDYEFYTVGRFQKVKSNAYVELINGG